MFLFIYYYIMAEKNTLSIADRLNILTDAEHFFADLSEAGENAYRLGRFKAMALGTVRECLDLYKERMMEWEDWTEEKLEDALDIIVNEKLINMMIENTEMKEDEADFYRWGFGLSVGIVQNDQETLDGLAEQQDAFEKILEAKRDNKTLADLLS